MDLYNASEPVDIVTVKNRLREAGRLDAVGGEAGVESLAGMVPAAGNLRHYARIVRDHALLRSLLTTTMEIQASVLSHEAAPRDLVERAEKAMLEVGHDERQKEFRSIHDVLDTELEKLHRLSQDQTALTGVRSGYTKLDELTGGFQNGNLVVIAARPSMGKSPHRGCARVRPAYRRPSPARRGGRGGRMWGARRGGRARCRPPSASTSRARRHAQWCPARVPPDHALGPYVGSDRQPSAADRRGLAGARRACTRCSHRGAALWLPQQRIPAHMPDAEIDRVDRLRARDRATARSAIRCPSRRGTGSWRPRAPGPGATSTEGTASASGHNWHVGTRPLARHAGRAGDRAWRRRPV